MSEATEKGDDGFEWYITQDEFRWEPSDASSREEAIACGRSQYQGESFYICRAVTGEIDLAPSFDWLMEDLSDNNAHSFDPDGDRYILDNPSQPTRTQELELESMIAATIREWAERNDIRFAAAWNFVEIQDMDFCLGCDGYDAIARQHYHAIIARMGGAK